MTKFRRGDRVKFTNKDYPNCNGRSATVTGTVSSRGLSSDVIYVTFDNTFTTESFSSHHFTKIEECDSSHSLEDTISTAIARVLSGPVVIKNLHDELLKSVMESIKAEHKIS